MKLKYLLFTFLAVFVLGVSCQSDEPKEITSHGYFSWPKKKKRKEPSHLPKVGQVTLQPHQVRTIDYLYKSKQKGLLINHYLGTGKTILSLAFTAKYPDRKVYVILPRFLKGHWQNQLKLLNLDPKRFVFTGLNELKNLEKTDFKDSIVIIDESHKLVELLDAKDLRARVLSSKIYLNVQKAHKVLALTGTPIYSSPSNIAHQINLVSGSPLIETNQEKFKLKYMEADPTRSYFRGHLLESNIVNKGVGVVLSFMLPLTSSVLTDPSKNLTFSMILPMAVQFVFPWLRNKYSLDTYGLKVFSVQNLKPFAQKYVSFYGFDVNQTTSSAYPSKKIYTKDIPYNLQQYKFYLACLDKNLSLDETWYFLRDDAQAEGLEEEKRYLSLNINSIQQSILDQKGFGREIGNMIFKDQKNLVIPPKFNKVFKKSKKVKGPVVIYSHYYHNGSLLFYKYLKSKGVSESQISLLHPDDSVEVQNKMVADYNLGKTKYFLIHPEITEGISLKGTAQLHFLETPINKSFQEQIIGRAIRYHSHHHLPKEERHVDVYIWKQILASWDMDMMKALRYNWFEKNRELNYYSLGGAIGRNQLDKNSQRKSVTPDHEAFLNLETLSYSMLSLRFLLAEYSIESLES